MLRVFRLVAILFITFIFQTFAQNLVDFISKELPPAVTNDRALLSQVIKSIEGDFYLNPELVCLRLQYLDNYFNKGITEKTQNGLEYLSYRRLIEYEKRDKWLQEQIDKTLQSEYHVIYKTSVAKIFESFKTEYGEAPEISNSILECDKNKENYFVSNVLADYQLSDYNSATDYKAVRMELEKNIISKFEREYDNLIADLSNRTNIRAEDLLKYWYVFNNNSMDFEVCEILLAEDRYYYNVDRIKDNNIFIGGSFLFLNEKYDVTFTPPELPVEYNMAEIKNYSHLHLQYTHKIKFSEVITSLSHVNLGIYFAIALDANASAIDTVKDTRTNLSENDYIAHIWQLRETSISDIQRFSLFLKVSVPVLAIGRFSSIDVGFFTGVNMSSYNFNYSYRYLSIMVDYDEVYGGYHNQQLEDYIEGPISENTTKFGFIFYPTLEITLYIADPVILQFGTGYNFMTARVGIGF